MPLVVYELASTHRQTKSGSERGKNLSALASLQAARSSERRGCKIHLRLHAESFPEYRQTTQAKQAGTLGLNPIAKKKFGAAWPSQFKVSENGTNPFSIRYVTLVMGSPYPQMNRLSSSY